MEYMTGQHPLSAPSVFNFYQPNYSPIGEISDSQMVAPEFQITNATTVIGVTNQIGLALFYENLAFHTWNPPFETPRINLIDYEELAADPEALIDRLNIVLTQGQLSRSTRDIVLDVLDRVDSRRERAMLAIYLILISSDYSIED